MNQALSKHKRLWSLTKSKITVNITPIMAISFIIVVIVCIVVPLLLFNFLFKDIESSNAKAVITVLPALKELVNAETENNSIPWFNTREKVDVEFAGKLLAETTFVRIVKDNYSYTLYRFSYKAEKIFYGNFDKPILTFFVERVLPTPGSHIWFKELWPFSKDKPLTFKLRKGMEKYLIVSIEYSYPHL